MTHIKFNHSPLPKTFGGIVEDILNGGLNRYVKDDFLTNDYFTTHPPVNIVETPDAFLLDVVAPGFSKEDFKIQVDQDLLTISYEKKEEKPATEDYKTIRREFSYRSFKRSFSVDKSVDVSGIQAKYENGLLKLLLPKKEEVKQGARQINID